MIIIFAVGSGSGAAAERPAAVPRTASAAVGVASKAYAAKAAMANAAPPPPIASRTSNAAAATKVTAGPHNGVFVSFFHSIV